MDVWSVSQSIFAHPFAPKQWKGETSGRADGSVSRQEAEAGPCLGRDPDDLNKKHVFVLDPDAGSFVIAFYPVPEHTEPQHCVPGSI